jgi:hypothetical protein
VSASTPQASFAKTPFEQKRIELPDTMQKSTSSFEKPIGVLNLSPPLRHGIRHGGMESQGR